MNLKKYLISNTLYIFIDNKCTNTYIYNERIVASYMEYFKEILLILFIYY